MKDRRKDRLFVINGVKWVWRYSRLRGSAAGWTFYLPGAKDGEQRVVLCDRARGRARLELEIHEFMHAANPALSEEHVLQAGRELANILWALGYRRLNASKRSSH